MDPITLILTALTAGIAASAQETASSAIKDAYNGLKALIQRKFVSKPEAEMALVQHAQKPEVWKGPLEEGLKETGADHDEEILAAAEKMLQLAQAEQPGKKYDITFQGPVQGPNIGDHNTITQTFGDVPN